MPTQEATITKEVQKSVLKAICELPTLTVEELTVSLNTTGKKISQEEVLQVVHGISPNTNWHRATKEDIQKEILQYVWTLESQILFLLPTKQRETTVAEFNQTRLQNKQPKAPKDLIRYLVTVLVLDNKNLAKFRKFEKELTLQNDVDPNTQAIWSMRILLANVDIDNVKSKEELSAQLVSQFKENFPLLSEKVSKNTQRITERFIEKYFPKSIQEDTLKGLITSYQLIYRTYKKGTESELATQSEFYDQIKLVQNITEKLKDIQEIIGESHEGGVLSKLLTGKIKNREGVIEKIDGVIHLINQINDLSSKTNKTINEKVLLIQKLQSDYENVVLVKNQLEGDLYNLKEKLSELEEKNRTLESELQNKTEILEKAHEKIAALQQKADTIPELETKTNSLREELSIAKDIALRLYARVNKLKGDLLRHNNDKPKNNKTKSLEKTKVEVGTEIIHSANGNN